MDRWQLDAIVCPHETKPVLKIADAVRDNGNSPNPSRERKRGEGNRISTVTGLPTLTVPAGFNIDGVPVGIEFLGRHFDEATIIRIAYAYEQAHPQRKLPATTPLIGVETLSY